MASCLLSQQNIEEARNMLEKSLELWQGKDEELPQVCKGFANLLIGGRECKIYFHVHWNSFLELKVS